MVHGAKHHSDKTDYGGKDTQRRSLASPCIGESVEEVTAWVISASSNGSCGRESEAQQERSGFTKRDVRQPPPDFQQGLSSTLHVTNASSNTTSISLSWQWRERERTNSSRPVAAATACESVMAVIAYSAGLGRRLSSLPGTLSCCSRLYVFERGSLTGRLLL